MSKPTTPSSRCATASSAISRERAWCRIAVSSWRTTIGRRLAAIPSSKPVLHGRDDLLEGEPLVEVLLGGVADLGVHDAVGGQVLHALPGHPGEVVGALHHRDGVVEGLQVALQRAAVGRLGEPAAERLGVVGRQGVADLAGELDDRRGAQTAVEVVVQQHLRGGPDQLGVSAVGSDSVCTGHPTP